MVRTPIPTGVAGVTPTHPVRIPCLLLGAALLMEGVIGCAELLETDPSLQTASGMVTIGRGLLVIIAWFGVARATRWGFWLAGVLAAATLLEVIPATMNMISPMQLGGTSLGSSLWTYLLVVSRAVTYALFLVELWRRRG